MSKELRTFKKKCSKDKYQENETYFFSQDILIMKVIAMLY